MAVQNKITSKFQDLFRISVLFRITIGMVWLFC